MKKAGLDVMRSYTYCTECVSANSQVSSAVLGWPGDGDCYLGVS